MNKLKPCPFCGGEAEVLGLNHTAPEVWVKCKQCNASTEGHNFEPEAVAEWNKRVGGHCAFAQPTDLTDGCALLAERTCRWEYPQGINGWNGYTVCSSCGEKYDECVTDTANYCPNCGAKVVEK